MSLRALTAQPILTVSVPPHAHCGKTVRAMYTETLLALVPAVAMAVLNYGVDALRVVALAAAVAVIAEVLCTRLMEREPAVDDMHAMFLGVCFAFLLPATVPWWLVVCGSTICVVLGKMVFGGIGASPLNAVAVGWAVCRISWPKYLDVDAMLIHVNYASPASSLKYFGPATLHGIDPVPMLLGQQLGGLGAVQVLAVLVGGLYLLARGWYRWEIPVSVLVGVVVAAGIFTAVYPGEVASPLFHLAAGSTLFGAFFLATDCSSSPSRTIPMVLYGLTVGAMIVIIRVYGIYPDGVPFAILLANLVGPMYGKIRPKPFGAR